MTTAVVLNLPEPGHMNATYATVAELTRRGERVVYFATEPFRAHIEATGAVYASYGDPQSFIPPAHTGGLYSVMAWLMGLAEEILPELLERIRAEKPSYLLVDSMCVWGHLAARILGIPAVTIASVFVPDDRRVPLEAMLEQVYGRASKEQILEGIAALDQYIQISRRVDHRHGVVSPNMVEFFAGRNDLNIVFTSREFHLDGEHFDGSYRFVGPSVSRPAAQEPLELGDPATPLLYISLGTIFNDAPAFYRACIEAFAGEPVRVLISAGAKIDLDSLGHAPANFLVRRSVPQLRVLEEASLFLTHGGMNSVNEALWHGVPLLVYPQHGDQHLVAARVAQLGAGMVLRPGDIEPAKLREMAAAILSNPQFRRRAGELGASMKASGGASSAADAILAYAAREEAVACL